MASSDSSEDDNAGSNKRYRINAPPSICSEDDSSGRSSCSSYGIDSPLSEEQRLRKTLADGISEVKRLEETLADRMSQLQRLREALVDRISQLPDPLLVQILSLLPTKYAFATSILSKRWISLCTFVDSFNFSHIDFRKTENGSSFVEHVLAHSVTSKLKKLKLDFEYLSALDDYSIKKLGLGFNKLDDNSIKRLERSLDGGLGTSYVQSQMSRCLNFAVERNVESVEIRFRGGGKCFLLPQSFCTCSSLITLVCDNVSFDGVIEWKSLKSLKLKHLRLPDTYIVDLLDGCPALETLELSHVGGFNRLEINPSNVERMTLTYDSMSTSFEIFAPYIQHLEISGDPFYRNYRLVDVSSVVSAKLTFDGTCTKRIWDDDDDDEDFDDEEDSCHDYHQAFGTLAQDYLVKLSNATQLIIGTWFTDILCLLQLEGVLVPELKCKYLMLELHIRKFSLYGAAGLLQASPHMETLSIDMETRPSYGSDCHCRFGLTYLAKGDAIDLQSRTSSSVFPKLKKVEIVISSEDCDMDHLKCGFDKLFKLSEFLLKTATVLEEFIIVSKRVNRSKCSMNCVPISLFNLAEKLWSCQRSSAKSRINLKVRAASNEP